MNEVETEVFHISDRGDVTAVKRHARSMALAIGFEQTGSEEVAITASELADNIVKYAGSGTITLRQCVDDKTVGIEIEAKDRGPGLPDSDQVFMDGYSSSGTLGSGLGAVNRLMDDVKLTSDSDYGTFIQATKWLKKARPSALYIPPLDFGAASRPHPKMNVNGDAFVIKHWQNQSLLAVIDGVGHGVQANKASLAAKQYIETHYDRSLANIFQGVSRACRGTRGVVMALIAFDWKKNKLSFAGVGNIEVRTSEQNSHHFLVRRGIVGLNMPEIRVIEAPWQAGNILIVYSDGIASHWKWSEFRRYAKYSASQFASDLLKKMAKDNDDATVAVIKDK